MSRNTKIIVGVVAGLVLLCVCLAAGGVAAMFALQRTASSIDVGNLAVEEPAQVNEVAIKIVNIQLPDGYNASYAMDVAGLQIVLFEHSTPGQLIILLQAPDSMGSSPDDLRAQLEQMLGTMGRGTSNLVLTEERPVTVLGQETTAYIREGVSDEGGAFRSLDVAFQGKSGPALLVMSFPTGEWDEALVQQVLDSMK